METTRIQYATSADGTQIACSVIGSGPPLVVVTFTSAGLDVRLTSQRGAAFYEALAEKRALICFDWRDSGLSDPATTAIRVRIGINAGEPIAEDDDLFGASVIAAARIAAKAQGCEILVSNVVRELVAGKGFVFAGRGETELRGFDDPVRLQEARWQA